jgi:hypothetical protein
MDKQGIFNIIKAYAPQNVEITNKTYASRIDILSRTGISLEDHVSVMKYLKEKYKEKTYKSFMIAIVVWLNATGKQHLATKYSSEMKKVNDVIQEKELYHVPTTSEKENFVKRSEITNLISGIKTRLDKMEPVENYYMYFDLYKQYLVLNLYYLIPPLRNDYVGCEVYTTPVFFPNAAKNYIYTGSKVLVLNRYKTSRFYGKDNTINLPQELVDIVNNWMKVRAIVYPRLSSSAELLVTKDLVPFGQVNLTQFLNRIFGRKVSSTMLRKSYLSEKYPVEHTQAEMVADAKAMMHSVGVQQSTYRKKF